MQDENPDYGMFYFFIGFAIAVIFIFLTILIFS